MLLHTLAPGLPSNRASKKNRSQTGCFTTYRQGARKFTTSRSRDIKKLAKRARTGSGGSSTPTPLFGFAFRRKNQTRPVTITPHSHTRTNTVFKLTNCELMPKLSMLCRHMHFSQRHRTRVRQNVAAKLRAMACFLQAQNPFTKHLSHPENQRFQNRVYFQNPSQCNVSRVASWPTQHKR